MSKQNDMTRKPSQALNAALEYISKIEASQTNLTRQDLQLLADAMHSYRARLLAEWLAEVEIVASVCELSDDGFDRAHFFEACGDPKKGAL
jgi:hypothetical protein